jgi:iron complex outermembrane receptor protein
VAACFLLVGLLGAWSGGARAVPPLGTAIAAQPVADALPEFARQTGLQLFYVAAIARERLSKGAAAGLGPTAALTQLLDGTGLGFEFLNAHTVRIFERGAPSPPASAATVAVAPRRADSRSEPTGPLEDVVVTGFRGAEPVSRVPLSMTVWSATALEVSGAKNIATLANLTPGVEFDSYSDFGPGIETNIAVRGINARDGSTTAVYIDDTPIPSDRASSFGRSYPVLFDLDRMEVLRGAQGALLGEGAEGGAVRFVPAAPSLTAFSGHAETDLASTTGGAPSFEISAAAGGPLSENVIGYRVGAWSRREGGYVNRVDPFTGAVVDKNANRTLSQAFKLAFTVAPLDALSITPSISYQSIYAHDDSAFYTYLSNPGRGQFLNGKLLDQPAIDHNSLFSVKVTLDLGAVDLSEVSAYYRRGALATHDGTNNSFWFWPNPLGPEYPLSYADAKPGPLFLYQNLVSHQLRLESTDPSARVTWLAGVGYLRGSYHEFQAVVTSALSEGGYVDGATFIDRETVQLAGYGQLELRLREHLTATVGARVERESYHSSQYVGGIGTGAPEHQQFFFEDRATPTAPRVNVSYKDGDTGLYYATAAKGYRMGGPNPDVGAYCYPTPPVYRPDSVWNFELGAKNSFAGARVQTDVSVFHMRWRDIQTQVSAPDCGSGYTINAGGATSNGFDLGARAALGERLVVGLTATYEDAHYTHTVLLNGLVVVGAGDVIGALPLVAAPWSATVSIDCKLRDVGGAATSLHLDDIVHSRNPGPFTSNNPLAVVYVPERQANPATNLLNLRAAARWPHLELALYLNNALGSQPTLGRRNYIAGDTLFYATTFRPRTVGMTVGWRH